MPRIVALDLGTANVKASIWNVSGRKATFVERLLHPVPQDGTETPGLEQQLGALQQLLDEHGELKANGTVVAACYGGPNVSMHRVSLPFDDKKQIEKTLPFAVEAEVPFDLDDMVLGWRLLEAEEGTEAMVALAEESALRATIEGLGAHQLEPRQIATDKELLARWATVDHEPMPPGTDDPALASPTIAVLDIGHSRTIIAVVRDGEVLGSRVMDVGGADVTRAIQQGLGCSWANAERLKHGVYPEPDPVGGGVPDAEPDTEVGPAPAASNADDRGDADEEDTASHEIPEPVAVTPWDQLPEPGLGHLPDALQETVRGVIGRLLAEVRSSLIGFEDSLGVELEEVRIGGGGARLEGLLGWLHADLGVSVVWATGEDGVPIPCEYLLADALGDIVAGHRSVPFVDLRTGPLAFRRGVNLLQAVVMYGGALALFFTLAMGGLYVWQSWTLGSEIATVQQQIDTTIATALPGEKVRRTSQAMLKMRQRIDEANARAKALGDSGVPPTVDMVHSLSKVLPPPKDLEIDVTNMKITPNALTFEAEVKDYDHAAKVEEALKADARFSTCEQSNQKDRRGRIAFSVNCDFQATGEEG